MKQSNRTKKRRGRPATGQGKMLALRAHPPLIKRIDAWAKKQPDDPSQAEAMRRLIEMGLASVARGTQRTSAKTANEASDLAGRMIDVLGDGSAPAEEREKRKRRLLKGPSEFREMRSDHPKVKG